MGDSRFREGDSRSIHDALASFAPSRCAHSYGEHEMSDASEKDIVRIDLTSEQKDQIKAATENSAEAIELTVQELEARIAPTAIFSAE